MHPGGGNPLFTGNLLALKRLKGKKAGMEKTKKNSVTKIHFN